MGTAQPLDALSSHAVSSTLTIELLRMRLCEAYTRRRQVPDTTVTAKPRSWTTKDHGIGRLALKWLWQEDERWATIMLAAGASRLAQSFS